MGVTASVADQKSLYATLHRQHGVAYTNHIEIESSDEFDADEACIDNTKKETVDPFFATANQTYIDWHRLMKLKEQTLFCELTEFEDTLEAAFRTGLTPLILDTSLDDKVCTFFSYQPDVILLDAKAMILAASAGSSARIKTKSINTGTTTSDTSSLPAGSALSIEEKLMALDTARKALVNSMKFGKLLVIRLGTSTPDFLHVFCDQALGIDTSKAGSAYFPLEVFCQAGSLLHDADALARSDDVSRKVLKVSAKHAQNTQSSAKMGTPVDGSKESNTETGEDDDTAEALSVSKSAPALPVSPKTATATAVKTPSWAERLYREEDMKPHKNFALCRYHVPFVLYLPHVSVILLCDGTSHCASITTKRH